MSDRPDFSELIKSPYDDDGARGFRFPGWLVVPAVALLLGIGVGWIAADGPSEPEAEAGVSTTTSTIAESEPEAVQETGFPEGFVPASDDVAVRVLTEYEVQGESYIVVAAATKGDADRDSIFMQSFGAWAVEQPTGTTEMHSQAPNSDAPGLLQIRIPTEVDSAAVLVGEPVDLANPVTVRLFDDAPPEMTIDEPIVLDVDGTEVVIDTLQYNLQEGYAVWHSDGLATIDIVVTLDGTEDFGTATGLPYRVGSFDTWGSFLGQEVRAFVPRWSTGGELRMGRAGAFRLDEDAIENITVDATITLATDPGDPVTIPIP